MSNKLEKLIHFVTEYKAKFMSEKTEQNFKDAKLDNGSVIRMPNEVLAIGDTLTIITEEGELPLVDNATGEYYTLEDGTKFAVLNGLVSEVIPVEEPMEDTQVEDMPVEASAPATPSKDEVKPKRVIKSQVEEHVFSIELENEIIEIDFSSIVAPILNENKELKEKFASMEAINLELANQVQGLDKALDEVPATGSVEKFSKPFEEMTALEKFRYLKNK